MVGDAAMYRNEGVIGWFLGVICLQVV